MIDYNEVEFDQAMWNVFLAWRRTFPTGERPTWELFAESPGLQQNFENYRAAYRITGRHPGAS